MYKAIDIAKYIVSHCSSQDKPVSNLKLQKILYYSWIDYYKRSKDYLFDDTICAWMFGPVIPEVYYEFCVFAGNPINRQYSIDISKNTQKTLDPIIEKYNRYSVSALVSRSHEKGGAWDRVYSNGIGSRSIIPYPMIVELECKDAN